jgi:hypothetical protein
MKNFCVKRFIKIVAVLSVCLLICGCILIPAIDGVKKMGFTKSDREALLQPEVERFQEYVYWNRWQQAGAMVRDDLRNEMIKERLAKAKGYRLVDSKVDFIEFDEDGSKALVDLTIRRYKVPFYLVEEVAEQQTWEFTVSSGWKFVRAEAKKPS